MPVISAWLSWVRGRGPCPRAARHQPPPLAPRLPRKPRVGRQRGIRSGCPAVLTEEKPSSSPPIWNKGAMLYVVSDSACPQNVTTWLWLSYHSCWSQISHRLKEIGQWSPPGLDRRPIEGLRLTSGTPQTLRLDTIKNGDGSTLAVGFRSHVQNRVARVAS
jgi:hypothetical protein